MAAFMNYNFQSKQQFREVLKAGREPIIVLNTHAQQKLTTEEMKLILGTVYEKIIEVLKQYCDLKEEYYPVVATWIIGTYLHKSFNTYPYLFIN